MYDNYKEILHAYSAISTDRLLLRTFTLDDAEDILEYSSDEESIRYLAWDGIFRMEDMENFIKTYYSTDGVYALELKETGHVIGAISISVIPEHEKACVGYVLNKKYWRQGFIPEALLKILWLAFEELSLNRVEATHYVGNEASGKVMEKCGFQKEGLALQEVLIKGIFRDVVHYGITKEQWKNKN